MVFMPPPIIYRLESSSQAMIFSMFLMNCMAEIISVSKSINGVNEPWNLHISEIAIHIAAQLIFLKHCGIINFYLIYNLILTQY